MQAADDDEDDEPIAESRVKGDAKKEASGLPKQYREPIVVGEWVVLIEGAQALLDSFRGTPYDWVPAMNQILGTTMKVLDVKEDGDIIGLEKLDSHSPNPIWYYSRTIVKTIVKDLHTILRAGAGVLAFLSVSSAAPAFRASLDTRHLLSALMTMHVSFSVLGPDEIRGSQSWQEAKRHTMKVPERLPHDSAAGPCSMYVRVKVKDVPMKRAALNRALSRALPMVRWEDARSMKINTHENIESLDKVLYKDVFSLGGADTTLLLMDRHLFKNLKKITFSMSQFLNLVRGLGEELYRPDVDRVKIF
jgi:hypothetical protein